MTCHPGSIVYHPQHRIGVVQQARGRERSVAFIAADDSWVHVSELTDVKVSEVRDEYFLAKLPAARKLLGDIADACGELILNFLGVFKQTKHLAYATDPMVKILTEYKKPVREGFGTKNSSVILPPLAESILLWLEPTEEPCTSETEIEITLPTPSAEIIESIKNNGSRWAEEAGATTICPTENKVTARFLHEEVKNVGEDYVLLPLKSQRARNFLGVRLKRWRKTAADILRSAKSSIVVTEKGFRRTPTSAQLKAIRAASDFNKVEEFILASGWWNLNLAPLFGADPTDWEESLIPRMPWVWTSQKITADMRFQPYMAVRPDRGINPNEMTPRDWGNDYEEQQSHFVMAGVEIEPGCEARAALEDYMEAGILGDMDDSDDDRPAEQKEHEFIDSDLAEKLSVLRADNHPHYWSHLEIGEFAPNVVTRPEHKCQEHGVMWGADNCRVCRPVVFKGKQARLFWEAVDKKRIKPILRGLAKPEHGPADFFRIGTSAEPPDFALVLDKELRALGLDFAAEPGLLRRFEEKIRAMSAQNFCIICGRQINRELNYCTGCAGEAVVTLEPTPAWEQPNVYGSLASFAESKARPLSERNLDFGTVKSVARTFVCQVLSEVTGREIDRLGDSELEFYVGMSPQLHTLFVRFWLWTHGTPVADIAAMQGVERSSVSKYIDRWQETLEGIFKGLGPIPSKHQVTSLRKEENELTPLF